MFTEKTVIILGAGASCHLGFPTGETLIENIINSEIVKDIFDVFERQLKQMQPLSIDTFLSYHEEWEGVGKQAIAYELLKKESKYKYEDKDKGNWYRFLIDALIRGCRDPKDILRNNDKLSIVTFNYDISLEYYLYTRLKTISFFEKNFSEFVNNLKIVHVYGQLSRFNWHKEFCEKFYEKEVIERDIKHYGNNSENKYKTYAKSIEIVGIRKWQNDQLPVHIKKIRDIIKDAKNIYVLGFGFYEENMDLIGLGSNLLQDLRKRFYYTNYGNMQKIERQLLKRGIRRMEENFIKSEKSVYKALAEDFDFCE